MRKLTLSLMAAATIVTIGGGAALAQQAPAVRQAMTRAAMEQRAQRAFDRLDANNDGKIDQTDRAARQKARFDRLDADKNGQLSYAEFTAVQAQRAGDDHGRSAERHSRHGDRRVAMRGMGRGMAHGPGGLIRVADADKDGVITRAEFQAAALQRFERLDINKDGTVTGDEAKAARDNLRQQWQSRRGARAG
jgi:Ca2+-binding EF-hand superfamily protein